MTFTNEERREVAARLRGLDEATDTLLPEYSRQEYDAMVLRAIRAVVGEGDVFHLLANLIDRPTCHDVTDLDRESFKCSRCGYRVLSIDGAPDAAKLVSPKGGVVDFGYCPNCGAEVVDK